MVQSSLNFVVFFFFFFFLYLENVLQKLRSNLSYISDSVLGFVFFVFVGGSGILFNAMCCL